MKENFGNVDGFGVTNSFSEADYKIIPFSHKTKLSKEDKIISKNLLLESLISESSPLIICMGKNSATACVGEFIPSKTYKVPFKTYKKEFSTYIVSESITKLANGSLKNIEKLIKLILREIRSENRNVL